MKLIPKYAAPTLKRGQRGDYMLRRALVCGLALWDDVIGVWFVMGSPVATRDILDVVREWYGDKTALEAYDFATHARCEQLVWDGDYLVEK